MAEHVVATPDAEGPPGGGPAGLTDPPSGPAPAPDEGQAAHNYELIGRLAGGIVHDFNKLLTVILGNLSLLQASLAADASQRRLLGAIEDTAQQAADLTRQLLALARHEPPRSEPVDVNAVAERVAGLLRHTIDPRVELQVQPRAGPGRVQGDPGRLTRVLLNLCLNACDAMPRGGRLRIAADEVQAEPPAAGAEAGRGPGTFARLTVEDTGEGMPEEVRARIFDPFFTTKQPGVGTGLGLAVVTGLVREAGGWVTCDSAPGRGTRFEVYLPVRGAAGAAAPLAPATTVLVVEGEEPIRELTRMILEKQGYRVVLAADGRQAIESFRRAGGKVALVVLDAHTAPVPGTDTLAELRAIDPGVRVLLVNGPPPAAPAPGGPQGVLAKPFQPADLLAAVRAALGASQAQGGAVAGEQGVPPSRSQGVSPDV